MGEVIETEDRENVKIIRLNRAPKLNALNAQLLSELRSQLGEVAASSLNGVVLTGVGRAFSVGVDLNDAAQAFGPRETVEYMRQLRRAIEDIEQLGKPVAAAIEGYCLTGGLEIAIACDRRFAGQGSVFAITSARIGSVAGMGATQRLPRLVGISAAKDMLFTGRHIDANEAASIGLVDVLCRTGEALEAAIRWVNECGQRAPLSVWAAKWSVNVAADMPLNGGLDFEAALVATLFQSSDKQEGMKAFLEKRDAQFEGR
jgi:enoyl-CoA hydratase/carnithine racemase